jgi:hypothetical protein
MLISIKTESLRYIHMLKNCYMYSMSIYNLFISMAMFHIFTRTLKDKKKALTFPFVYFSIGYVSALFEFQFFKRLG